MASQAELDDRREPGGGFSLTGRYRGRMFGRLIILLALAAAIAAVRKATSDRGGSYDPSAHGA